jgi:hypothetical protein
MKQNEKLLHNMKELDKQKLPKWFNGELYDKGAEVRNRFSGDKCQLNNVELSMYDFITGTQLCFEMGMQSEKMISDFQKALRWFRKHNAEAYMILLD